MQKKQQEVERTLRKIDKHILTLIKQPNIKYLFKEILSSNINTNDIDKKKKSEIMRNINTEIMELDGGIIALKNNETTLDYVVFDCFQFVDEKDRNNFAVTFFNFLKPNKLYDMIQKQTIKLIKSKNKYVSMMPNSKINNNQLNNIKKKFEKNYIKTEQVYITMNRQCRILIDLFNDSANDLDSVKKDLEISAILPFKLERE